MFYVYKDTILLRFYLDVTGSFDESLLEATAVYDAGTKYDLSFNVRKITGNYRYLDLTATNEVLEKESSERYKLMKEGVCTIKVQYNGEDLLLMKTTIQPATAITEPKQVYIRFLGYSKNSPKGDIIFEFGKNTDTPTEDQRVDRGGWTYIREY